MSMFKLRVTWKYNDNYFNPHETNVIKCILSCIIYKSLAIAEEYNTINTACVNWFKAH